MNSATSPRIENARHRIIETTSGSSRKGQRELKVFLLNVKGAGIVFYGEKKGESAPRNGLRGWLERQHRRWLTSLRQAENSIGATTRRVEGWLEKRVPPDEALLRSLRDVNEIEILHPTTISEKEAARAWREYLARARNRHLRWLLIDLLIVPLTLLLMPLPGPNFIGYWLVYRAICHALALFGARRALNAEASWRLTPIQELNAALSDDHAEKIAALAHQFNLVHLRSFVKKTRVRAKSQTVALAPEIQKTD